MTKHLLEIDSVILRYGERDILSNVYLKCETGELIALFGRNGAGKSSLLKLIFGSLHGESQSVRIDKKYHHQLYTTSGNIRFLPQSGLLPGNLKVAKAINFFVGPSNRAALMEDPYLAPNVNERVGVLSGGLKKYLECLLIVYSNVKFVLLDEPFTHVSPIMVEVLKSHLLKQSAGKGIILTDHLYEPLLDISHRMYLIEQGRTVSIEQRDDLIARGYINP
ncbi:ATP-binding cassette domain-containing protein [Fulvivirgaceae bacterium BMA12]|uniref:ATP-binding cassette domain-containing protein n=1 Tax=Agaribacillus aureus TaxID=3051825 RepID=A0ABT8L5G4_9BACT|nr:ATP-binding cassette domain-containing protein [Fulvivirgaceae bacterium BMA12]